MCIFSQKMWKGYFGGHGQGHYLYKKMDQERVYVTGTLVRFLKILWNLKKYVYQFCENK